MRKSSKRKTLAKAIASEDRIPDKLQLALGQELSGGRLHIPSSDEELFAFIRHVKWMGQWIRGSAGRSEEEKKLFAPNLHRLGLVITAAVSADPEGHKFFSKLASSLQYSRGPKRHRLYSDILAFCHRENCGAADKPCDGLRLASHLRKRGHKFGDAHDNQVPRTLRATCKKLGILLARSTISRPPPP